jgi:ankyrin repeat protein
MPVPGIHLDNDEKDETTIEDALSAIQLAAWQGDLVNASRLLENGVDPNEAPRGWYGKTALQAAALQGHVEIVKLLLEAGASVDAPGGNNGGRAALALAAWAGHETTVELLLNAGADVNLPPHRYVGRTPLQAAAEFGSLSIVERLVKAELRSHSSTSCGGKWTWGCCQFLAGIWRKREFSILPQWRHHSTSGRCSFWECTCGARAARRWSRC